MFHSIEMELKIASKASQAVTFPALLVAYFAKETANVGIDIVFEEVEVLDLSTKASVVLKDSSEGSVIGSADVLRKLASKSGQTRAQASVYHRYLSPRVLLRRSHFKG